MTLDLWSLYALMLRSRLFEEAVAQLWEAGHISGEMHLGIGEEAIIAGVVSQLEPGDAMALDHRGTSAMLMRGVDPIALLREFLGCQDGLCGGMGGHMHLFSKEHLAASSGIVGAAGPAALGFALAAQHLRPGTVAVAFFGEGASNQGMLLEALNLAVVWRLPVIFVCKDDQWAITTPTSATLGGSLVERARGFGLAAEEVDGTDVEGVWNAAHEASLRARHGGGPTFIHATCHHLEGHFLGDKMVNIARQPVREMLRIVGPIIKSLLQIKGAPLNERFNSLMMILGLLWNTRKKLTAGQESDPIKRARVKLEVDTPRLQALEESLKQENQMLVTAATQLAWVRREMP